MFTIPKSQTKIAVALSGGGDSMALAHMMCVWAQRNDSQVHLLHVNHNLRDEALAEAEMLTDWVKDFPNAEYHILTWHHDRKPETGIMEKARTSRYTLMADHCARYNIKTICAAHHADDQLETFLFRLCKGSGLDGLTGMNEWIDYDDTLKIYRPLLGHSHSDLIAYCETHDLIWIEDPSNQNEQFTRPRLRKALAEEGLDGKRFTTTLNRLSRAQEALQWATELAAKETLKGQGIDYALLKTYPFDIQIRVVQKSLMQTGHTQGNYPPKLQRVEEIVETLKPGKSATLFGCVLTLSKDGNRLEIAPSNA